MASFDKDTLSYEVVVVLPPLASVPFVTIETSTAIAEARVGYSPVATDADTTSPGHQVTVPIKTPTTYTITVTSASGSVTKEYMIEITRYTLPGAPGGLDAQASYRQVELSWNDPSNSDIDSYQYRVSDDGGNTWDPDWTEIDGSDASTTGHTLSDLNHRKEYTFGVRAVVQGTAGTAASVTATPAATTVPHDWDLRPPGIATGKTFRLLIVTSDRRNGQSGDVDDYNDHVQDAVDSVASDDPGHAIRAYSSDFRALVGTKGGASPRDNTHSNTNSDGDGEQIWWLNGPRAADDYEDFYDGSWDHTNPVRLESGNSRTFYDVDANDKQFYRRIIWTGARADGGRSGSRHLGSDGGQAYVGVPYFENGPLRYGSRRVDTYRSLSLYGLSPVFLVEAPDAPYAMTAAITTDPANGTDYQTGEVVKATVTFSEDVTVMGTPQLPLRIGGEKRNADYVAGDSSSTVLSFSYTVTDDDTDLDGISIDAFALKLNGGSIKRTDTNVDAALTHTRVLTDDDHKVNLPPLITGVEVTSTPQAANDTYGLGEDIEITVTFNEAVTASDDVEFGISAGGQKQARLKSGNGTTELVFAYTVQADDEDDDGIWIGNHNTDHPTFDLQDGQSVTGVDSGRPALLEHSVEGTQSDHKVDGINTDATLSSLTLSGISLDQTFTAGAAGTAVTSFTATTDAAPTTVTAILTATPTQSGASVDIDPDDADTNTTDHEVDLDVGDTVITVAVTSSNGDVVRTYTITVTRPAGIGVPHDWDLRPPGVATGKTFRLLIVTSDRRNGQSGDVDDYNDHVQDAVDSVASDDPGHAIRAYSSDFRALVGTKGGASPRDNTHSNKNSDGDGEQIWWLNGPRAADDYEDFYDGSWDHTNPVRLESGKSRTFYDVDANEQQFNRRIIWTGSRFDGVRSGSRHLGSDGGQAYVGVPYFENGPLRYGSRRVDTYRSLSLYGLSPVFLVEAPDAPYAMTAAITTDPANGTDYRTGEVVKAAVTFSEDVTVVGTPQLPLQIGDEERDADYVAGDSSSTVLSFSYTVTDDDTDRDGISIDAFALKLNGGTIKREDTNVDAALTHTRVLDDDDQLVNLRPLITDIEVTSTPQATNANDTYGLGEDIEITVTFSEAVNVTGDVDFGLSVGGAKRARLARGNGTTELVFAYTVQSGDDDDNGIFIGNQDSTNATLALQDSQTIVGAVSGLRADLDHDEEGRKDNHKVDGSLTAADATLSALSLSDITLVPAFDPRTTAYTATTRLSTTTVTIAISQGQNGATGRITAPADADLNASGHQVNLAEDADTVITITVTSSNGDSMRTYTVTVTRQPAIEDDATLSVLALSGGITLAPAFDPRTTAYAATTSLSSTTVTATASQSGANMDIDPDDADTAAGHQVDLAEGDTVITVTVISSNGDATRIYTITVTREAVVDMTAPSVDSATVSEDGTSIDIVFDEDLDNGGSAPAASAFEVTVDGGTPVNPTSVDFHATGADTITLTMATADTIAAGAAVSVAYDKPTSNALADAASNEVESFTGTDAIEAPNRPAAPVVTLTPASSQITATWAEPANGGSAITGYDLEWKTAAQTWAQAATAGQSATPATDATDHEITGLTNNTEYTVRVRAENDAGDGPWSAEASETPTVGVPKAVTNLTAAGRDEDFRVDWDAPDERGEGFATDADGNPVLVYRISWNRVPGGTERVRCVSATAANRFKDGSSNPDNGGNYKIVVEARFETVPAVDPAVTACADQTGFGPMSDPPTYVTVNSADPGDEDDAALAAGLDAAVAALEDQQPWMRTAWDHLEDSPDNTVLAVDHPRDGSGFSHSYDCSLSSTTFETDALDRCYSIRFHVDIDWDLMPDDEFEYLLARELGRAWFYNTDVHTTAQSRSAVGRALLYFSTQDFKDGDSKHVTCTFDAMADAIAHVAVGTPAAALDAYGATCFTDERAEPAALTEAVVRHALHPSGTDPDGDDTASSWFTDTYATGAEAWAAVESITPRTHGTMGAPLFPYSRSMVVTLLQDEFGGYCSPLVANEAAFGTGSFENVGDDNDVTDPWNTFGCEPGAPTGVTVSAPNSQNNIDVAWTAPTKGGAPITGYTVQWRTTTQTWAQASSQSQTIGASPPEHQISVDPSERYVVRVRAVNNIGDGEWSAEVTSEAADDDANLTALSVEDTSVEDFDKDTTEYSLSVAGTVARATFVAAKSDAGATVAYTVDGAAAADSDSVADGHQVDLDGGSNEVVITVTASDGTTTKAYTVTVHRAAVPHDWSLRPDGVAIGGMFRLLFVTSTTRNGRSTDIGPYDKHVQDALAADGAHDDISDYSPQFKALAGTRDGPEPRAHTGTDPVDDGIGVAIWWLDGPLAAADNDDFYDYDRTTSSFCSRTDDDACYDGWAHSNPARVESGETKTFISDGDDAARDPDRHVWTGTGPNGEKASSIHLGSVTGIEAAAFGLPYDNESVWALRFFETEDDYSQPLNTTLGLYGLSDTLYIEPPDAPYATTAEIQAPANGTDFRTGEFIDVRVTFSEAVRVQLSGMKRPRLPLRIGGGGDDDVRYAIYQPNDSTDTELTFGYLVTADDQDLDGFTVAKFSLDLNDATIRGVSTGDHAGVDAALTHTGLVADETFKVNLPPLITGIEVTSTPKADPDNDTYGLGEDIEITVTFSEAVDVAGDVDFGIAVDGEEKRARLARGDGTAELVFAYTVQATHEDDIGIWIDNPSSDFAPTFNLESGQSVVGAVSGLAAVLEHDELGTQADHKVDGSLTAADATLSALSLSDITLDQTFTAGAAGTATTSFTATATASSTTVTATATQSGASSAVVIAPADADTNTAGHQVNLAEGTTEITVTVTPPRGDPTRIYTITVTRQASADIEVSWAAVSYAALEGRPGTTVTLMLSAVPADAVTVPISTALGSGASSDDYSGVPTSVTFDSASVLVDGLPTESFTVVAVDDDGHDGDGNDETLTLSFGTPLPDGVTAGTPDSTTVALVDNEVPATSDLVPDGTVIGESFRLLFVTSNKRNAESSDIADYDSHIQTDITENGSDDIKKYVELFRVLGSTAEVDARDHTGTTYASMDLGVPIWWVEGPKAADHYEDFYDGEWDHRNPGLEADGDEHEFPDVLDADGWVWTGTTSDGIESYGTFTARSGLGLLEVGIARPAVDKGELFDINTNDTDTLARLYGLSFVLRAAAPAGTPYVTEVAVDPGPADGDYETGDTITVEVTFSEPVSLSGTGEPTFPLEIGKNTRDAAYQSISSDGTVLTFSHPVTADDIDHDGISITAPTFDLPTGASITDGSSVDAYLGPIALSTDFGVNVPPFITGIEVTSTPEAADETYGLGEDIEIKVTFSEAVNVEGAVDFGLSVGGARRARLKSGSASSNTTELVFVYTVQAADVDSNGIFIGNHDSGNATFDLQTGQSVVSVDTGRAALLEHDEQGTQGDHKVDGSLTGADATLSALSLSGITLDQTFTAGAAGTATTSFTATTTASSTTVTATPTQTGGSSDVAITPADADTSTEGHQVDLAEGDTVITVTVTSTNGNSTRTYTITVTREAAADIEVSWAAESYAALEGHPGTTVTLMLSAVPADAVTVPISTDLGGGAEAADHSVVPTSVTFDSASVLVDGLPTESFVVVATDDDFHDGDGNDETLTLGFETPLPDGVSAGTPGSTTVALVDNEVPATSDLVPDTIAVGKGFRLLFVTSNKRNAESTDIDVYNRFVQKRAKDRGHADIRPYSSQFQVLASTTSIDARDNTATNPDEDGRGVPIWWLNGLRVADDYDDFWDGTQTSGGWDNQNPVSEEDGDRVDFDDGDTVYTGTYYDGTTAPLADRGVNPLGVAPTAIAKPSASRGEVFTGGAGIGVGRPLYGLSYVLYAAVPAGAPYVTGVETVAPPDGPYRSGDTIKVRVTFSEAVTVTGAPTFPMEIGSDTRQAEYQGTESTSTGLVFTHLVTDDDYDNSSSGISNAELELDLPAGTSITSSLDPTVAAYPGSIVWKSDLKVNPNPRLTDIEITSDPMSGSNSDTYASQEVIEFTVTFDVPVTVTGDATDGDITLRFFIGDVLYDQDERKADLRAGDGTEPTEQLVFTYTVISTDTPGSGVINIRPEKHSTLQPYLQPFDLVGDQSIKGHLDRNAKLDTIEIGRTYPGHMVNGRIAATDASLSSLSLDGITLAPAFDAGTLSYTASADTSVTSTTVTATPRRAFARAAIDPDDADTRAGHQVALTAGTTTTITVTVTAPDRTTQRVYTIDVSRAAPVRVFAGNGQVSVEWNAPTTGAEGGYRVSWSDDDFATFQSADVGAGVTAYTISGLTNGAAYVVRVVPLDASSQEGMSTDSDAVTVGRPKAVGNLTVQTRNQDFRVSWDAPDERGEGFLQDADGDPVLVYRVSWEETGQETGAVPYQKLCQTGTAAFDFYEYYDVEQSGNTITFKLRPPGNGEAYSFAVEARFQTGSAAVLDDCRNQSNFGPEAETTATATEDAAMASEEDHVAVRAALEAVVDARDENWPWLRTAWAHASAGTVQAADLDQGILGNTGAGCTTGSNSPDNLGGCTFGKLEIDIDWDLLAAETFEYVAVHELAHVWTLVTDLHDQDTRGPVGRALLYFFGQEYKGDSASIMALCATETLADALAHVAEGVAPADLAYYGDVCFSDGRTEPAVESEGVALYAMHPSGADPNGNDTASSWFTDTFTGDAASAEAWDAVSDIGSEGNRFLVMNLLQDEFNGLCSIKAGNVAASEDSDIISPWTDGGCEPDAPTGVTAAAGGAAGRIDVAWTAPANMGGALLLGYTVQWKFTAQAWPPEGSFSPTQQHVLDDPAATAYTITGLTPGLEHTVRVRARNSIGDGVSDDVSAAAGRSSNRAARPPSGNLRAAAGGSAPPLLTPLTARFAGLPDEHDGASPFTLQVVFSGAIETGHRTLRDRSLSVSGGDVTAVRPVAGQRHRWDIEVRPASDAALSISLPPTHACGDAGAVCSADGRALSNGILATVPGPATARRLTGSAADDTLSGRAGDDVLRGGLGADTLSGGDGDDTLVGDDGDPDVTEPGEGDDLLDGEGGHDTLHGDGDDDTLYGGTGHDDLYGGAGHDVLYGDAGDADPDAGDDLLDGGSGHDVLYGDGGDDVLAGGAGDDTLTGGAGADTFVFAAADGADTITDFFPEEGDRIDLSAFADLGGFASLTLTADGDATILDLRAHGGGTVRLPGIAPADLLAADFLWP